MPVISNYLPNAFYWPGMCSGDAEASKRFYSELLGWDPVDASMPGGDFTAFKINGTIAAGMYQMPDDRKAAGVRPHWNSYLCVDDIDRVVKAVPEAGGKVLLGPFDADGSLMANLEDPTGAKFSVWQAMDKEQDPTVVGELGALCWTELVTPDVAVSKEFYSRLFGWKPVPFEGSPVPYTAFGPAEEGRDAGAGMFEITPEMQGMTAQWLPYFLVEDADKTAEKVGELGGKAHGVIDVAGVGRIGMMSDSEGAAFAVLAPTVGV